jgi:4-amino-4-deoxy-L-arabinose transferase-like glycosyltransferase
MEMKKRNIFLIGLIVCLAFFLRFYKVTEIPPSLNWDEVSIGYNAYSILKTGRDEWNVFLPVHFRSYGEYKLPIQIYTSIPGIAVFGLNEMGVRITPVIYGTLTVLALFFLARKMFKSTEIGLISAFLLAISPWHIQLTRGSFESSLATFWIVLALWFFIKGLEKQKWWIWSMVAFVLSIYTYNTTRVFTPLLLIALALIYRKTFLKFKKVTAIAALVMASLLLPLLPYYFSGEGNSRYKLVSVTDDPGLIPRINENRGNSLLPEPLPKLIHNKYTYISFYVSEHYLAHFTPDFLFISGAPHKQHHVQGMGELYWFQAPFLLLGIYLLYKKRQPFWQLLTAWLLLAFVPVSVTNDSIPHALRTLVAVPVYQILTALGIYQCYLWLRKYPLKLRVVVWSLVAVIAIFNFINYLNNFYNIYPDLYSRDWQYGYKQTVDFINKHSADYDLIVFTRHYGEPHMFTLFFTQYDPAKYQNNSSLVRFETYDWVRVLKFDKYYFPDLGDQGTQFADIVAQNPGKKILFIGKPGDFTETQPILETVNFLDGNPDFIITEVK